MCPVAAWDIHPTSAPYPTPSLLPSLPPLSPGTSHLIPKTRRANRGLRMPRHTASAAWTEDFPQRPLTSGSQRVRDLPFRDQVQDPWILRHPHAVTTDLLLIPFPAASNCLVTGHRNADQPATLIFTVSQPSKLSISTKCS